MNDRLSGKETSLEEREDRDDGNDGLTEETGDIRIDFQHRLLMANLRTEAVRAGMIDLDGLKLMDLSTVHTGNDDRILGGQKLMDDLRRSKPWLFKVSSSSSSAASIPTSQPVRQKMASEMTDEEYSLARTALIRYRF